MTPHNHKFSPQIHHPQDCCICGYEEKDHKGENEVMGYEPRKLSEEELTQFKDLTYRELAEREALRAGSTFTVKDSGKREEFAGGMVRDTAEGKQRPDLVRDGPMYLRWVRHLTKGASKYKPRNWMLAVGEEEYERALESTDRHFIIWYTWMRYGINIEDIEHPTREPLQEDHAAGVFFNINLAEYVREKIVQDDQKEPGI